MSILQRLRILPWLAAFVVGLGVAAPAFADPPGRVGRIADVFGQVWMYDDESREWIAAVRNQPLTHGDRISTDRNSRATVQVGSSTWRLDSNTELEVEQLDDSAMRVRLQSGSIALRTRSPETAAQLEVVTQEGRFQQPQAGHFRLDRDDNVSSATVWSGTVQFRSDDSELQVNPGREYEFWFEDGRTHYSWRDADRDGFADWALAEDARDDRRDASRYVSPEMTGADDLDRYGRWENSPEYGTLWVPSTVAAGWAPYRYGHWAWVSPWGWTWVDDAPWGFAPFHYGRWVSVSGRWCWSPGRYVARPVYAPALVAWVGTPGASVSVNVGSRAPAVGWFPLAPREAYVPTYRVSPVYIRNVNVTQVTNINATTIIQYQDRGHMPDVRYANRYVANAVTAVPADRIGRRQPVGQYADARIAQDINRQPVSVGLPVAAMIGQPAVRANPRIGTESTQDRRVVPQPPNRAGFEQRPIRQPGERPGRIGDDERARAQVVPPSPVQQRWQGEVPNGRAPMNPQVVVPARPGPSTATSPGQGPSTMSSPGQGPSTASPPSQRPTPPGMSRREAQGWRDPRGADGADDRYVGRPAAVSPEPRMQVEPQPRVQVAPAPQQVHPVPQAQMPARPVQPMQPQVPMPAAQAPRPTVPAMIGPRNDSVDVDRAPRPMPGRNDRGERG